MSRSTELIIKVGLDSYHLWCGSGSVGEEMGLRLNEKYHFYGESAVEFMESLVRSTSLGNAHKQIVLIALSLVEEYDVPDVLAWLRD